MSGGKKKRGVMPKDSEPLDPLEKELFLRAFFQGDIPQEEGASPSALSLPDEDKELFLKTVIEGIGHALPKEVAKSKGLPRPKNRAQRRGTPDATLDLHGMVVLDAIKALLDFLKAELGRGSKTVLIIHGKGSGVLRDAVWSLIERHAQVGDFQVAPSKLGGGGALLVRLHREPKGRRNF